MPTRDHVTIRPLTKDDADAVVAVINAAAQAYRGVIPDDRWQDPYMTSAAFAAEIAAGVMVTGADADGRLVGAMGTQRRGNVDLIRHAYVLPAWQGRGVGAILLRQLCHTADRPVLIGTWRAAAWAVRFYQRHGFALVAEPDIAPLLRTYWTVPERQIETSVVLAMPPLVDDAAARLIAAAALPLPA